ncbi:hypothetical protein CCACVL1_21793 [Corchorus capsularis]|uniref:Uncharacterized protein n=1 Tax=Corchorus capsularis TaxID=210143 RepID=A0A1R3H1Z9_COCAP|nr:hypothetical protein CCACVL1_21793 [Corchorus capsularis]
MSVVGGNPRQKLSLDYFQGEISQKQEEIHMV